MSAPHEARFVTPLDLLLYFRSVVSVGNMANSVLVTLASQATERFVPAGTVLLREDDPVDRTFVVVEGRVEIDAGPYQEIVEPPSGVNWLRLHGGFETSLAARALVDTLLLEIPADVMREHMERHSSMVEHLLRIYAGQIIQLRDHLPVHPENAVPADPGTPPTTALGLVERMSQVAGPGGYWESANLDAVVTFVRQMSEVRFKRGDVLLERGRRSSNTLNLVSGTALCTNAQGRSVEVGAGYVLGIYDALADSPGAFSAVATHDGVALRSDVNEMLAVLEHHSDMALALLRGVARSLSAAYDANQISGRAKVVLGASAPRSASPGEAA